MDMGKRAAACLLTVLLAGICFLACARKEEPLKVAFYYENVCHSCKGDEDFYRLYNQCVPTQERSGLDVNVATYNVFMESCREYYQSEAERLGIPKEVQLPVLIVGDQWVSGYEDMEAWLYRMVVSREEVAHGNQSETADENSAGELNLEELARELAAESAPMLLLFTTNGCEDCEGAKEWLRANEASLGAMIREYNIVADNCTEALKGLLQEYGVAEESWNVPALFCGGRALTGKKDIMTLSEEGIPEDANESLAERMRAVHKAMEGGNGLDTEYLSLATLAGSGLLAGLNPCAGSMLLMLLSLILAEKASVWKSGLLYLAGKYATYLTVGMTIYLSASQIEGQMWDGAIQVVNGVLVVLFGVAGLLYLSDAIRVFRKDYGHIRTQLPVKLRRMNHNLIKRAAGHSGTLPILILGLGVAISLGEFFCTGQIYMATITWLLKEQRQEIWLPFLVYVTAMSLPSVCMIMVVQRTRNAERVSNFMLRHMGAIKIFSAALFLGYMLWFLLR